MVSHRNYPIVKTQHRNYSSSNYDLFKFYLELSIVCLSIQNLVWIYFSILNEHFATETKYQSSLEVFYYALTSDLHRNKYYFCFSPQYQMS